MNTPTGAGDYEASNEALRRICGAYRISCDRWWDFRGAVATGRAGSLEYADVRFSDGIVIRDRADARYLGDHYFLIFQADGAARMRQRGNDAALEPGDCTIIDSRFPSWFEVGPGFHQYSFHFPAGLIHDRFSGRSLPLARVINGRSGAGGVLSDLLMSFVRNAATLEGVNLTALALHALSVAIGEDTEPCVRDGEAPGAPVLHEMVQYIDAHVHEAQLTPAYIASHFNTSLRRLYRLTATGGCSPAALIWRRRLEQARKMLASHSRVPIIDIALSCGFKDGAHFSRAYRKAYGHPPKLARSPAGSAAAV